MKKEKTIMAKYVCTVCGYTVEADKQPDKCPLCNATTFNVISSEGKVYADEHKLVLQKV